MASSRTGSVQAGQAVSGFDAVVDLLGGPVEEERDPGPDRGRDQQDMPGRGAPGDPENQPDEPAGGTGPVGQVPSADILLGRRFTQPARVVGGVVSMAGHRMSLHVTLGWSRCPAPEPVASASVQIGAS